MIIDSINDYLAWNKSYLIEESSVTETGYAARLKKLDFDYTEYGCKYNPKMTRENAILELGSYLLKYHKPQHISFVKEIFPDIINEVMIRVEELKDQLENV